MKDIINYFKCFPKKFKENFLYRNDSGIYYVNWIGEKWIV